MVSATLHIQRSHPERQAKPPEVVDTSSGTREDARPLALSKPQDIVHCLLFIIEYSNSSDPRWLEHKRHLNLFFSRDGGLHLLLMLLNAYYNKPPAGAPAGYSPACAIAFRSPNGV